MPFTRAVCLPWDIIEGAAGKGSRGRIKQQGKCSPTTTRRRRTKRRGIRLRRFGYSECSCHPVGKTECTATATAAIAVDGPDRNPLPSLNEVENLGRKRLQRLTQPRFLWQWHKIIIILNAPATTQLIKMELTFGALLA